MAAATIGGRLMRLEIVDVDLLVALRSRQVAVEYVVHHPNFFRDLRTKYRSDSTPGDRLQGTTMEVPCRPADKVYLRLVVPHKDQRRLKSTPARVDTERAGQQQALEVKLPGGKEAGGQVKVTLVAQDIELAAYAAASSGRDSSRDVVGPVPDTSGLSAGLPSAGGPAAPQNGLVASPADGSAVRATSDVKRHGLRAFMARFGGTRDEDSTTQFSSRGIEPRRDVDKSQDVAKRAGNSSLASASRNSADGRQPEPLLYSSTLAGQAAHGTPASSTMDGAGSSSARMASAGISSAKPQGMSQMSTEQLLLPLSTISSSSDDGEAQKQGCKQSLGGHEGEPGRAMMRVSSVPGAGQSRVKRAPLDGLTRWFSLRPNRLQPEQLRAAAAGGSSIVQDGSAGRGGESGGGGGTGATNGNVRNVHREADAPMSLLGRLSRRGKGSDDVSHRDAHDSSRRHRGSGAAAAAATAGDGSAAVAAVLSESGSGRIVTPRDAREPDACSTSATRTTPHHHSSHTAAAAPAALRLGEGPNLFRPSGQYPDGLAFTNPLGMDAAERGGAGPFTTDDEGADQNAQAGSIRLGSQDRRWRSLPGHSNPLVYNGATAAADEWTSPGSLAAGAPAAAAGQAVPRDGGGSSSGLRLHSLRTTPQRDERDGLLRSRRDGGTAGAALLFDEEAPSSPLLPRGRSSTPRSLPLSRKPSVGLGWEDGGGGSAGLDAAADRQVDPGQALSRRDSRRDSGGDEDHQEAGGHQSGRLLSRRDSQRDSPFGSRRHSRAASEVDSEHSVEGRRDSGTSAHSHSSSAIRSVSRRTTAPTAAQPPLLPPQLARSASGTSLRGDRAGMAGSTHVGLLAASEVGGNGSSLIFGLLSAGGTTGGAIGGANPANLLSVLSSPLPPRAPTVSRGGSPDTPHVASKARSGTQQPPQPSSILDAATGAAFPVAHAPASSPSLHDGHRRKPSLSERLGEFLSRGSSGTLKAAPASPPLGSGGERVMPDVHEGTSLVSSVLHALHDTADGDGTSSWQSQAGQARQQQYPVPLGTSSDPITNSDLNVPLLAGDAGGDEGGATPSSALISQAAPAQSSVTPGIVTAAAAAPPAPPAVAAAAAAQPTSARASAPLLAGMFSGFRSCSATPDVLPSTSLIVASTNPTQGDRNGLIAANGLVSPAACSVAAADPRRPVHVLVPPAGGVMQTASSSTASTISPAVPPAVPPARVVMQTASSSPASALSPAATQTASSSSMASSAFSPAVSGKYSLLGSRSASTSEQDDLQRTASHATTITSAASTPRPSSLNRSSSQRPLLSAVVTQEDSDEALGVAAAPQDCADVAAAAAAASSPSALKWRALAREIEAVLAFCLSRTDVCEREREEQAGQCRMLLSLLDDASSRFVAESDLDAVKAAVRYPFHKGVAVPKQPGWFWRNMPRAAGGRPGDDEGPLKLKVTYAKMDQRDAGGPHACAATALEFAAWCLSHPLTPVDGDVLSRLIEAGCSAWTKAVMTAHAAVARKHGFKTPEQLMTLGIDGMFEFYDMLAHPLYTDRVAVRDTVFASLASASASAATAAAVTAAAASAASAASTTGSGPHDVLAGAVAASGTASIAGGTTTTSGAPTSGITTAGSVSGVSSAVVAAAAAATSSEGVAAAFRPPLLSTSDLSHQPSLTTPSTSRAHSMVSPNCHKFFSPRSLRDSMRASSSMDVPCFRRHMARLAPGVYVVGCQEHFVTLYRRPAVVPPGRTGGHGATGKAGLPLAPSRMQSSSAGGAVTSAFGASSTAAASPSSCSAPARGSSSSGCSPCESVLVMDSLGTSLALNCFHGFAIEFATMADCIEYFLSRHQPAADNSSNTGCLRTANATILVEIHHIVCVEDVPA